MRKQSLTLLSLVFATAAFAQLSGNGYYRVQNQQTTRYITIQDNRGSIDMASTKADMMAIKTKRYFDNVVDDPSSIIYIEKVGSQYNLLGQGCNTKDIVAGRYLNIKQNGPTYQAYGTVAGIDIYLSDSRSMLDPDYPEEGYLVQNGEGAYRNWYIRPVNQNDEQYFGFRSAFTVGNLRYTSNFASFPIKAHSSGLKFFKVTKVDGDKAVWEEIQGTVPAATAVIVQCPGDNPTDNRADIVDVETTVPADNLLKGVYFCNGEPGDTHFNKVTYDPNTMRLLGITSKGKLGFVTSTEAYLPRNRAYLVVPEGSPSELTLMTSAEYEVERQKVTIAARNASRIYGDANPTFAYDVTEGSIISGEPKLSCSATTASPVGNYDIVVEKGTVSNTSVTLVNGTLTVTKAALTVTARSYTIKQNEPLPVFAADYAGFKNGESESVLTTAPSFSCNAPAEKTPGIYTITVTGAAAQNYNIGYVAGTLTIVEADPITITADNKQKVYGDENPQLTWQASGEITGTPVLSTTADKTSGVGDYPIMVAAGSVSYPNLKLVNGTLTVTKAMLTVTARSYTIKQNEPLPVFAADYAGFKNGDDANVFTAGPAFTCDVPQDKTPGAYTITVSGCTADNYAFSYVAGTLTIVEADPITIKAVDARMTYGDDVPQLTYTVEGGTIEGEPVITCEASSLSDAGTYTIKVSQGTVNYPNLVFDDGLLTIDKALLTVSVGDYEREEGTANPVFELTYEGFRNGDDESVLIQKPVAATDADEESPVGEYPIVVEGGEAQNYDFSYVNGLLKVVGRSDGIASVTMVLRSPADVYTLSGRKVLTKTLTLEGLPKGIYVVNGHKVIVR